MGGGVQKEVISEGVGIASRVFFRGLRVRFLSKQSVILPLIDFFEAKTIVFIDDLLFAVGFMLFSSLAR